MARLIRERLYTFKETLFPEAGHALNLDEIAQVIEIKLRKLGENLHESVAEHISALALECDLPKTREFFTKETVRVVTTNYDKLLEELAGEDSLSVAPGLPVPRSDSRVKVLHVHGSVNAPSKMVVTSDDYFRFMEKDSYFSRKTSSLIHENTVVIFGYSLSDTNLKALFNEQLGFVREHRVSSNIFFVSRGAVTQEVIDYYYRCYGIRVIQNTTVEHFFETLSSLIPSAKKRFPRSIKNYKGVFQAGKQFKDERIREEESFFEIVASMGAMGSSLDAPEVVSTFDDVISRKQVFAKEPDQWDQYVQLAKWLVYLGSVLEIRETSIENTFLKAVEFSLDRMSKKQKLGYSWHAHTVWDEGWSKISADNRSLIAEHIANVGTNVDGTNIVARG